MSHDSWQQEQFSLAYVRAVASVAGYPAHAPVVDNEGIDLTFSGRSASAAVTRWPRLEAQIKSATSGKATHSSWSYDLKVGNFEQLRHVDYLVPRILILVVMPARVADWFTQTDAQLALRHCAYWVSLRGEPATSNKSTIAVTVRRKQQFSPGELVRLMTLVGSGETP